MTRSLARRAGPFLAIGGLLLTAAAAVPGAQNVAAPPPVPWPMPPLPDGPFALQSAEVREGEVPRSGQLQRVVFNEKWEEVAVLRLEPIEATTTR